jgi:hypothetical protein
LINNPDSRELETPLPIRRAIIQEAGLVGIGHMLGLGGDVAVALSLAKRMREILFGLSALAAWYMATRPKPVVAL